MDIPLPGRRTSRGVASERAQRHDAKAQQQAKLRGQSEIDHVRKVRIEPRTQMIML
ncbi:MAG: hypothetical protein WB688_14250 [Trebonia sp.]